MNEFAVFSQNQSDCLLFSVANHIVFCFIHATNDIASFIDTQGFKRLPFKPQTKHSDQLSRGVVFCCKDGSDYEER